MTHDHSSPHILIVDDHELSGKLLEKQLEIIGFSNVGFVSNAQDAWDRIVKNNYDIVLLDWSMPGMSGLDLVKKIRSDDIYNSLALVMVSAETQSDSILEAIEAGATFYLTKPVTQNTLKETMEKILAWRHRHF